jgi:hypothetical protein
MFGTRHSVNVEGDNRVAGFEKHLFHFADDSFTASIDECSTMDPYDIREGTLLIRGSKNVGFDLKISHRLVRKGLDLDIVIFKGSRRCGHHRNGKQ